jgi:antitoxin component YwqK of YwqJK toxin-antitoxin module
VSYEISAFLLPFCAQPATKGHRGSGTKQLSIAKGGVYAVQPEGAWRKAAQPCEQNTSVVAASFLCATCNERSPRRRACLPKARRAKSSVQRRMAPSNSLGAVANPLRPCLSYSPSHKIHPNEPFNQTRVARHMITRLLLLMGCFLLPAGIYGQVEHTRYPNGRIYSKVETLPEGQKKVTLFYQNGALWAQGLFSDNSDNANDQVYTIYHENGIIQSYYHEKEGVLLKYNEDGDLLLKVYRSDSLRITEGYYTSGVIMYREVARMDKTLGACPYYSVRSWCGVYKPHVYICRSIAYHLKEEFYPDGTPMARVDYGPFGNGAYYRHTFFNPDGTLDMNTTGTNHAITGVTRKYYPNGRPESIITLHNNRRSGTCRYWYETGIPRMVVHYREGSSEQIDSCFTAWYSNGQLKRQEWYTGSRSRLEWSSTGNMCVQGSAGRGFRIQRDTVSRKTRFYFDLIFFNSSWLGDAFSNLSESGESLPDGMRTGTWTGRYWNGVTAYECHFTDRMLDGAFQINNEQGKPLVKGTFSNGLLQGPYCVWYPNGHLNVEGNIEQDQFIGHFKTYYDDGRPAHHAFREGLQSRSITLGSWDRDGLLKEYAEIDSTNQLIRSVKYHSGTQVPYVVEWMDFNYRLTYQEVFDKDGQLKSTREFSRN